MKPIIAADLFCGAGGASTGLLDACEAAGRKLRLTAVNHWERAVETHAANHPRAAHHCEDLLTMDPAKAVPGGRLDLLTAAPECTHHSNARGGKPRSDQSRATAWCVQRWATALRVDRILVENVPEFLTWGPLGADGKPLKSRRGETFRAWVTALQSLGYRVEWKVLNAADYGAATSRLRLFVQAVRGRRPIVWPDPTHAKDPAVDGLFADRLRWRAAREVIDWSLAGESIFNRKRPLSANTLRRIEVGLRKFGGPAAEPFLVAMNYLSQEGHDGRTCRPVGEPLPTVTGQGNRFYLCEPFAVSAGGPKVDARPVSGPLNTVLTRDHMGLVEPFVVPTNYGERPGQVPRTHSTAAPLPTVTASSHHAVIEPFILPHRQFDRMDVDDIGRPVRTITATNGHLNGVCQPFVVPYYANGEADGTGDPLRTVTATDRFGLVQPDGSRIDIRFRMLQPHELAAAMGFPAGYRITGTRADQVRQIGNAVEVNQAKALYDAMLAGV